MVKIRYILIIVLIVQCACISAPIIYSDKFPENKEYKKFEKLYQIAVKLRKLSFDVYHLSDRQYGDIFDYIVRKNKKKITFVKSFFYRDLERGYFNFYILRRVVWVGIPGGRKFVREILDDANIKNKDKRRTRRIAERWKKGAPTKYNAKFINLLLNEDSLEGSLRALKKMVVKKRYVIYKGRRQFVYEYYFDQCIYYLDYFKKEWGIKIYKELEKYVKDDDEKFGYYISLISLIDYRKESEAIDIFIEMIKDKRYIPDETGHTKINFSEIALKNLKKVTGKNFGNSYSLWKKWWQKARKTWPF